MKRFAQLDNDIVTGILYADRAPEVVPEGRVFVDVTDIPAAKEFCRLVDGIFVEPVKPAPVPTLSDRIEAIAAKLGV